MEFVWTCEECGEEENTGDTCKKCDKVPLPWICPNCSTENKGYRLTCVHCLDGKP